MIRQPVKAIRDAVMTHGGEFHTAHPALSLATRSPSHASSGFLGATPRRHGQRQVSCVPIKIRSRNSASIYCNFTLLRLGGPHQSPKNQPFTFILENRNSVFLKHRHRNGGMYAVDVAKKGTPGIGGIWWLTKSPWPSFHHSVSLTLFFLDRNWPYRREWSLVLSQRREVSGPPSQIGC